MKRLVIISLFVGANLTLLSFTGLVPAMAGETASITDNINIRVTSDGINPSEVKFAPGTTVVWINEAGGPIRVRFLSNAVSTTCRAPRGFMPDKRGIYYSKSISGGGIASLCFLEQNKYAYEIDYLFESAADANSKKGEKSPVNDRQANVIRKLKGNLQVN